VADVKEKRSSALLKLGLLVALVVAAILASNLTPLDRYLSRDGIGRAIEWIRASESAPLLYIGIYAAATALAIPGSILTLAGGAMFGLLWGTVYTTVAANIGANAAFAVARFLGRDGVRTLAGDRLDALDRATRDYGFRGLLTLRLIPAVPFNALNFGAGLTAIGWPAYAAATAVGIFPGTVVYTMFADALLEGSREASRDALARVLVSGALLVLLSFLPTIARRLGIRIPGSGDPGAAERGTDPDTDGPGGAPGRTVAIAFLTASALAPSTGAPAVQDSLPSHQAFTAILSEVVEQPDVDYAELVERRDALEAYLATLGAVDIETLESAPRDARLAFWINAYNACMLRLVADHYPIEPDGGFFSAIGNALSGHPDNSVWQIDDVFTRKHCHVAGADRSQDEIEHGIIRPGFDEPRIHFAVNCAARSCPVLWPEAYTADRLDEQLDRAVRELVETPRHFEVQGSTVRMNKVLDWYKEDFGGVEGLRSFFAPYLSEEDAAVLTDPDTDIEFFGYDWTLNDTAS
jgi:uncharacterized membrane protein YdjX (TVP38/TMEM64 family)